MKINFLKKMRVFLIFCVFIFGLVIAESCSWATCRRSEDCCIGSCKIFLCVPFKSEQQNISQIEQNNQEKKHSDEIFSQVKQNSKNESHLMFQSKRSEHSGSFI